MNKYRVALKNLLENKDRIVSARIIQELVNKEIPMKPKSVNYCSNCEGHLYNQDYIDGISYCEHCGQRLDWSEHE